MTDGQDTKLFQYCCVYACEAGSIIFLLAAEVSYRLDAKKLLNAGLPANEAERVMLLTLPSPHPGHGRTKMICIYQGEY